MEPGQRSLQTAIAVKGLASELGVKRVFVVANKVRKDEDVEFIKSNIGDMEFLGKISHNESIVESDMSGLPSYKASEQAIKEVSEIKKALEKAV